MVAIDKFSKWIKARPITNIRSEQAVLYFTDIIHRFGIPNAIVEGINKGYPHQCV